MMNKFLATGRLGQDPEVRYGNDGGNAVARFSLAIDKMDKDHTTGFINCVSFGKQAEFVEKYFRKGMKIEFEGHVSPGSYTNKDGAKVYTFDFVAERVGFAESKGDGQKSEGQSRQTSNTPAPAPEDDGFMDIPDGIDENLPFN